MTLREVVPGRRRVLRKGPESHKHPTLPTPQRVMFERDTGTQILGRPGITRFCRLRGNSPGFRHMSEIVLGSVICLRALPVPENATVDEPECGA